MVEVFDSSYSEAMDASRAEKSEAFFKFSIFGVEPSREKERRKLIAREEYWSFNSVKSSLSKLSWIH